MADKSEEEYLNDLLKDLMESTEFSDAADGSDIDDTTEQTDDNKDIDDLLNEALMEDDQKDNITEPEITPIISENNNEFKDLVLEDVMEENDAAGEVSEETASEIVDEFGSDFFSDLQGIISSDSTENTKVDENAFRKSIVEEEKNQSAQQEDLSDILALDDGMSVDDIPDEHTDDKLTQEELDKISDITNEESDINADFETVDKTAKRAKKKRAKREKKKREPKPKKEKAVSEEKSKSKKSFKEFITLFDDEDEPAKSSEDNQELINELYDNGEHEGEVKETKPKKEKKAKTPKPKKNKAPRKVKKEKPDKANTEPVEKVYIGKGGVAIITVLVLVFLVGGYFGVRFLNYKLTINTAKNYYNICNYSMAYDELSGIDIMAQDEYFYEQVRILMIVNQGNDSYRNYIELGMETEAIDALINAVGRKQLVEEMAEKYNVTDRVNVVYQQLLTTLDKYGIDEAEALDLYRMDDYQDYYNAIDRLGGLTQ